MRDDDDDDDLSVIVCLVYVFCPVRLNAAKLLPCCETSLLTSLLVTQDK